jgi:hypothetical protein
MTRLIGHLVAATERHSSQKLSPHPDAIQIKRHGEIRQTCETYWRTKQNMQDRSTDHEGAPLRETITVMPDTVKANLAGPNTADKTHLSCVLI